MVARGGAGSLEGVVSTAGGYTENRYATLYCIHYHSMPWKKKLLHFLISSRIEQKSTKAP
jgi:hypothetical protein